jgi:glycosyltransferase involved in cell wall biosynthesis
MKVLFFSSGNTEGGISPLVWYQGQSLKKHGVDVEFFTVQNKGLKGYLQAGMQLRHYLKDASFDLLHVHYGTSGLAALIGRRKLPVVISFMGNDLIGSYRPDGSITPFSRGLIKVNKFLARKVYDFSIVKSSEMEEKLNLEKARVIPNGVDTDFHHPVDKNSCKKALGLDQDQKILLFLGNPARNEKNHPLAVKAVDSTKRSNAKLYTIYNKDPSEVRLWMNAADVLLLTSYHEGSPNAIKEAMAINLPIVTTDVGDVRENLGELEGHYITSFQVQDVTEKLDHALKFSETKGHTNGRSRLLELGLDSDSIAKQIIEVYRRVLNKKQ